MYISNLYIQGFKSFLPKTELVFDNGITCIVGPNGCGKTNIVDAIRWILGEQKSSVLRSTKMNDVIFSGSKNRRPISFCEVSLIIHNDKGKLPIEYSDVEIKRRYYRNGESEYFINKNRCRLKDITDLFIDTGMGANAYSVIELKMIENILSHNTSERKIMIEEAAGISKYKNQKNSTINKLKSTQYDLERIKDLIGEIQANVNNLKLQMKRYNRYEKLSYEISDLDINISKIKISNLNKQINPLNDKIVKNAVQQNKFVIDEKKIKRSLEKTEFEYLELKNTYNTSEKELRQFEEMLSNINERLLINTEKYKSNQLLCSQYNDELVQSEINLTSSLERKNEMEKKVDDFAPIAERDKKKYEKLKSQYYRTNKDYDEKLKQLSIMRNEFDVHIDYIQQLYAKSERVKVYIEEKNNFVKQSLTNKSFLNKQKKDIVKDSSNLKKNIINFEKKNNQIANRIKKEIKKQNVLETEVIKLENDIISLINFIDNKKERLSFYEDLNDNFSGYSKSIQEILKNRNKFKGLIGAFGDLIEVEPKYMLAIDTVISDYSKYLVVKSSKDILEIINWMQKYNLKDQIGIIALDIIPKQIKKKHVESEHILASNVVKAKKNISNLVNLLLGDVLIKNKSIDFENSRNHLYSYVDVKGNFLNNKSFYKVNSKKDKLINISKKSIIRDLKKEVSIAENQLTKAKELLSNKIHETDRIKNNIKIVEAKLDKGLKRISTYNLNLKKNEFYLSENTKKLDELSTLVKDKNNEISNLKQDSNEINKKIKELTKKKVAYQDELSNLQKDISQLNSLKSKHQQDFQSTHIKYVENKKEIENLKYRIKSNQNNQDSLKNKINHYKENIKKINKNNDGINDLINESKTKIDSTILKKNILLNKKKQIEIKYNSKYEIYQKAQKELLEFQTKKEENLAFQQNYKLSMNDLENSKKSLINRIEELYSTKIENNILVDENNFLELESKLKKCKTSLENIGPVNLGVKEEYDEENNRLSHLKEQYDDIVNSESNLKMTIDKIDKDAKSKLNKTFDEIAKNFIKTYKMFFDGGLGKLRLIQEKDDPLDFDLEIIAQPPGKKTQILRMLSAGEKALTAIALLFAIYLVKPSPFCILDEVDAPLDDSNVSKFFKAIKEFSKKTQFIIVTHNKLTMEKADSLYGVTNEEEGVSKVVSVKINKKIAKA